MILRTHLLNGCSFSRGAVLIYETLYSFCSLSFTRPCEEKRKAVIRLVKGGDQVSSCRDRSLAPGTDLEWLTPSSALTSILSLREEEDAQRQVRAFPGA